MSVIFIKSEAEIPQSIRDTDDELKAIYHTKDGFCMWIFVSRDQRNTFMNETKDMRMAERESHFDKFYAE